MTRSRSQLRMGNPDVLLLFALLARPHRHARILRTKPLSTSTISAQESRLAPQAARTVMCSAAPMVLCVGSDCGYACPCTHAVETKSTSKSISVLYISALFAD